MTIINSLYMYKFKHTHHYNTKIVVLICVKQNEYINILVVEKDLMFSLDIFFSSDRQHVFNTSFIIFPLLGV